MAFGIGSVACAAKREPVSESHQHPGAVQIRSSVGSAKVAWTRTELPDSMVSPERIRGQRMVRTEFPLGGRGCTTAGEIEFAVEKRRGRGLEKEAVLTRKPDGKGIQRHLKLEASPHKDFIIYHLRNNELDEEPPGEGLF